MASPPTIESCLEKAFAGTDVSITALCGCMRSSDGKHLDTDEFHAIPGTKETFILHHHHKHNIDWRDYHPTVLYYVDHSFDLGPSPVFDKCASFFRGVLIMRLRDAAGAPWYVYSKTKATATCDSCDGGTTATSRMLCAKSLEGLLTFVYTPEELRRIFKKFLPYPLLEPLTK